MWHPMTEQGIQLRLASHWSAFGAAAKNCFDQSEDSILPGPLPRWLTHVADWYLRQHSANSSHSLKGRQTCHLSGYSSRVFPCPPALRMPN